jgi:1-acyl-sn-glycerol-3-phosphate acyltransferase
VSADLASLPRSIRRRMHRLYEYGAIWFGLGLLGAMSLTWSLLAIPLYYLLPKRWAEPLGRWAITITFRIHLGSLALLGACRFDIRALDVLDAEGPLVIAPNHPCLLDAPLVMSRLSNLTCIMKADIVDNIFLGAGARLAGYIRNDAQLSMIKQAVTALTSGSHLLIFPEGTRTSRWPIGTCTGTAALIANRARVPIQTLFIETDSCYLTKGWPLLRRPALPITYRIRLGRRFDPPEQVRGFTEELERYFTDELRNTPQLLPPRPPQAADPSAPQHT